MRRGRRAAARAHVAQQPTARDAPLAIAALDAAARMLDGGEHHSVERVLVVEARLLHVLQADAAGRWSIDCGWPAHEEQLRAAEALVAARQRELHAAHERAVLHSLGRMRTRMLALVYERWAGWAQRSVEVNGILHNAAHRIAHRLANMVYTAWFEYLEAKRRCRYHTLAIEPPLSPSLALHTTHTFRDHT